jgi:hypothetical protein
MSGDSGVHEIDALHGHTADQCAQFLSETVEVFGNARRTMRIGHWLIRVKQCGLHEALSQVLTGEISPELREDIDCVSEMGWLSKRDSLSASLCASCGALQLIPLVKKHQKTFDNFRLKIVRTP